MKLNRGHWPSCPKDRPGDCRCLTRWKNHARPRVLLARGGISHVSWLPKPRAAQSFVCFARGGGPSSKVKKSTC